MKNGKVMVGSRKEKVGLGVGKKTHHSKDHVPEKNTTDNKSKKGGTAIPNGDEDAIDVSSSVRRSIVSTERKYSGSGSKKEDSSGFAARPPNVTDSEWELMRWKNPEKYGNPDFAKDGPPGEDKEFFFPRYFHHGAEWKIAGTETASHWLNTEKTYKSKWITTQEIKQRAIDRGNLQSRWRKQRKEDEQQKFGVSKHGVPVKLGEKGQPGEDMLALLHVWRDPTGTIQEYHEELTSDKVHPSGIKDLKDRTSVHSLEDPYYFGDPYEEDPSRYYREKRKKKRRNIAPSDELQSSESPEEESPVQKSFPKKSNEKPIMVVENEPQQFIPPVSRKTIPQKPPPNTLIEKESREPIFVPTVTGSRMTLAKVLPPNTVMEKVLREPKLRIYKPPATGQLLELKGYDYVYFNARRACTLPPRRPTPVYVDDINGTRHKYCPSGLACIYVNKLDYGKIPQYLKERNRELGRPTEPDFRRFYRPHICKYNFGHVHCRVCGRAKNTHQRQNSDKKIEAGDPFPKKLFEKAKSTPVTNNGSHKDNSTETIELVRRSSSLSEGGLSGQIFPPGMVPPPPPEFTDQLSLDDVGSVKSTRRDLHKATKHVSAWFNNTEISKKEETQMSKPSISFDNTLPLKSKNLSSVVQDVLHNDDSRKGVDAIPRRSFKSKKNQNKLRFGQSRISRAVVPLNDVAPDGGKRIKISKVALRRGTSFAGSNLSHEKGRDDELYSIHELRHPTENQDSDSDSDDENKESDYDPDFHPHRMNHHR